MIWTEEKIKKLIILYPNTDNNELSNILEIKKGNIISKANRMGIYKSEDFMSSIIKKRPQCKQSEWSIEEENFIINNFRNMSNYEISLKLNKTKKSVIRKISRMGIKRSKETIDFLRSKKVKENGRDLSHDFIKEQASKYRTRSEFSYMDQSSYSKAKKNGWLEEFDHLKYGGSISIPQLILMDILENFLGTKCTYNDRNAIKPLEIDCYFEKWKIGWEYNGKRYHTDKNDNLKKKICEDSGIKLFIIDEKSKFYRDYNKNIKIQLIKQIRDIKNITGIEIKKYDILNYEPTLNFSFTLRSDEIEKCRDKKLSDIKKIDMELYKKIKKYKLYDSLELNILNDTRRWKKFINVEEHIKYLATIKNKYKSFSDMAKNEHLYRKIKEYNVSLQYIKEKILFGHE